MDATSRTRVSDAAGKPPTKLLVGAQQLYEGPTLAGNVPHGVGAVLFADGSLMIAEFVNGTPGGDCVVLSDRGAVRAQVRRGQTVPFEISACITSAGGVVLTTAKSTSQSQYLVCNLRENTGALVQMTLMDRKTRESEGLTPPEAGGLSAEAGIDVQIEPLDKRGLGSAQVKESLWRQVFAPVQSHSHCTTRTELAVQHAGPGRCWVGLQETSVLGASLQVEPAFEFVSGTPSDTRTASPRAGLYLGPQTPPGGLLFTHLYLGSAGPSRVGPEQFSVFSGCTARLRSEPSKHTATQHLWAASRLADHGLVLHGEGVIGSSGGSSGRGDHRQSELGLWHQGTLLSAHVVPAKMSASKAASGIIGRMHQQARAVDRLGVDISAKLAGQMVDEALRIVRHWIEPASGIHLVGSVGGHRDRPGLAQPGDLARTAVGQMRPRVDSSTSSRASQLGLDKRQPATDKRGVVSGAEDDALGSDVSGTAQVDLGAQAANAYSTSGGPDWAGPDQMPSAQLTPGTSIERDTLMWSVENADRLNTIYEAAAEEDLWRSKESLQPWSARLEGSPSRVATRGSPEVGVTNSADGSGALEAGDLADWVSYRKRKLVWVQQVSARLDQLSSQVEQQIAASRTARQEAVERWS